MIKIHCPECDGNTPVPVKLNNGTIICALHLNEGNLLGRPKQWRAKTIATLARSTNGSSTKGGRKP